MKNDESACYYESTLAPHMGDFIHYKRTQGVKYSAVPLSLRSFSRFLAERETGAASIDKELIDEWCSLRPNESRLTQRRRIIETTQFLKYLSEIGIIVHLPSTTRKLRTKGSFVPYIFSKEELRRFFKECDTIRARTLSVMPVLLPVFFRLLLGCGLRISEALALKYGDVDVDNGVIVIRMSKFNKDRIVPLSTSMLAVLNNFRAAYHKIPKGDNTPFFAHRDGRAIRQDNIYMWYRKLLWTARISHGGRGNGPRVHDFRHTFAVYSLKSMTDKGMDIYCALPLLSTYLGHATVSATGEYVRLVQDKFPEIVEKTSAITAFVIPGGERP